MQNPLIKRKCDKLRHGSRHSKEILERNSGGLSERIPGTIPVTTSAKLPEGMHSGIHKRILKVYLESITKELSGITPG